MGTWQSPCPLPLTWAAGGRVSLGRGLFHLWIHKAPGCLSTQRSGLGPAGLWPWRLWLEPMGVHPSRSRGCCGGCTCWSSTFQTPQLLCALSPLCWPRALGVVTARPVSKWKQARLSVPGAGPSGPSGPLTDAHRAPSYFPRPRPGDGEALVSLRRPTRLSTLTGAPPNTLALEPAAGLCSARL